MITKRWLSFFGLLDDGRYSADRQVDFAKRSGGLERVRLIVLFRRRRGELQEYRLSSLGDARDLELCRCLWLHESVDGLHTVVVVVRCLHLNREILARFSPNKLTLNTKRCSSEFVKVWLETPPLAGIITTTSSMLRAISMEVAWMIDTKLRRLKNRWGPPLIRSEIFYYTNLSLITSLIAFRRVRTHH
jgi:hypothetical protein